MLAFFSNSNRLYSIIYPRKWVHPLRLGAFAEWKLVKVFRGKHKKIIKALSLSSSIRSLTSVASNSGQLNEFLDTFVAFT